MQQTEVDLLAVVSHELRNPLTSIIGSARTLLKKSQKMSDIQRVEFLEMIVDQGTHMLHLVEELLVTSKIEGVGTSIKRERVNISKICQNAMRSFDPATIGKRLVFKGEETVTGYADPTAVHQVLVNLIDNAVKYSDSTKPIVLSIEGDSSSITISVSDQGSGIAEDQLPNLFNRFTQIETAGNEPKKGVGFGLYLVKQLTEAHGGEIAVQSRENEGSTFTVTLPHRPE